MNDFELDPALAGTEFGGTNELRASLPVLQGSSSVPLEVLLRRNGTIGNRRASSELSDGDNPGDDEEDVDEDESDEEQESADEAAERSNDEDEDDEDDDDGPQAGGQSGNESAMSDRMRAGLAGPGDDSDDSSGISAAQAEILSQSRPPGLPPLPPRNFNSLNKSLPGRSLGADAGDDREVRNLTHHIAYTLPDLPHIRTPSWVVSYQRFATTQVQSRLRPRQTKVYWAKSGTGLLKRSKLPSTKMTSSSETSAEGEAACRLQRWNPHAK